MMAMKSSVGEDHLCNHDKFRSCRLVGKEREDRGSADDFLLRLLVGTGSSFSFFFQLVHDGIRNRSARSKR